MKPLIPILLLAVSLGVAACTKITPPKTELSRTTTTTDASGKPRTETVTASATGQGVISDNPDAIKQTSEVPELTLPGGGGEPLHAGKGTSKIDASFFGGGSDWAAYLIGLALIGGGAFVALRLLKVTLGLMMIGSGAFIIAGSFYPVLWIGAAACAIGYIVWTVIEAKKGTQAESGLLAVVKAINKQAKPVQTTDGGTIMVNPVAEQVKAIASPAAKAAIDEARNKVKT